MSVLSTSNFPFVFRVVDIIPQSDSGEIAQNSEPSIAVNPVNPLQMFAGTFGAVGADDPFFVSTDGGTAWSIFGLLSPSSIAAPKKNYPVAGDGLCPFL